ncbi:unnamed protein product [Candida verbasci]|uniref:DNA mismatch repair proteins mutS family domain-containing protein n=1 Tax=Candida verbasci TaxID=1227364 RepID=A0A9W4TUM1_9ASCO|nr:unnamed protein product [Candida verbasci]
MLRYGKSFQIISRSFIKSTSCLANSRSSNLPLEDWDRGGRKQKTTTKTNSIDPNVDFSPVFASIKRLMDQNPECVSLVQVGSFYELHFDQAEEFGQKLGIKVAYKKTSNHIIPMAGFPVSQLKRFVEKLVKEQEQTVAIIDQCNFTQRTTQNLVHRKVSRIISPGTLIDESFMNFDINNYLLAISFPLKVFQLPPNPETEIGLSWIDVSVGETFVQKTTLGNLTADIARISPNEILVADHHNINQDKLSKWYPPLQELRKYFMRFPNMKQVELQSKFKCKLQQLRKFTEEISIREHNALNILLSYVDVNLPEANLSLDLPIQYLSDTCLQMDARTREALELTERLTSGRLSVVGSLSSTIKRTCTPSGTRLLSKWIKSPLLNIDKIKNRQDYVKLFYDRNYLTTASRQYLRSIGDFIRIFQRLLIGNNSVSNLVTLADNLEQIQKFKQLLENENERKESKVLTQFLQDFNVPIELANEIRNTIEFEEPPEVDNVEGENSESESEYVDNGSYSNSFQEKYRIKQEDNSSTKFYSLKKDFNQELKLAHDELNELKSQEQTFISDLQNGLSKVDSNLKVIFRSQYYKFMHVLAIKGSTKSITSISKELHDDILQRKPQSIVYRSKQWSQLQGLIDSKKEMITQLERKIIEDLKIKVISRNSQLRSMGKKLDFFDVTQSFAVLATENNWICPKLTKQPIFNISQGRHVVVESSLKLAGSNFITNDLTLDNSVKIWVISGPNMGGKSTFLRQNALICILAQMGSYIPATSAKIGIVDRIFTRIGASDDLYNDLSTFMVEMIEISNILNNATVKSFAIVDEIGRGTSGKEGLAIAYSTLLHLMNQNKCRTLFATHYATEINGLLRNSEIDIYNVKYYRTKVLKNAEDRLIIDHALEPGISEKSYALEIAQKAGFPSIALNNARQVLTMYI